ncbi:CD209 antigen-like protein E [Perca fluviatilis]|uniref:CD209 antigen-like protein E n=1 Tax=Perca fluviatilis TaxID=8168 RepID=UPI0019646DD0|nr:CD209 antigen-like protein E [Perca fluviatilis]
MAEGEVNYASVVFKSNSHPPPEAKKEKETVYDDVKGQSKTTEETAVTNAGSLLEKKANNRRLQYQRLACFLGILCVILLLGIIAVVVVYHWRQCNACPNGWILNGSNCYQYNNPDHTYWKTWEKSREDCRGKGSDLVVVHNEEEKNALNTYSVGSSGYWFGLRAEGGRWKWIDGSDLTESYWTPKPPPPPATDGQCVMSVQNIAWISVSCAEKKQWICIMKALSV